MRIVLLNVIAQFMSQYGTAFTDFTGPQRMTGTSQPDLTDVDSDGGQCSTIKDHENPY